jgi:hypothetical protein
VKTSSINAQFISKKEIKMKKLNNQWLKITGIGGTGLVLLMLSNAPAFGQTVPVLKIAPAGTNQFSVTITNSIGVLDYDLEWTSVLGNTNFLWTYAAIGVPGGTNFLLNANPYPATFFRAVLDNNAVPLWQQSDPNNTNSPILTVTIASPANGANLSQ